LSPLEIWTYMVENYNGKTSKENGENYTPI
jgi:hypothetical protein